MSSIERPQITNEEAVLLWLAYEQARRLERGALPASGPLPLRPREFTMHQVEDACWQYWRLRGGKTSRSTMIRAAWRVLGPADRFGNRDG